MKVGHILSAICAASALASTATAQVAPRAVSLGDFYGLRTVHATIAGRAGDYLLDTGGGITVITPSLAEAVGCTPWTQITGFRLTGERLTMPRCDNLTFDVGGQSLTSPSAGVFDLQTLLPPDAPHIDGLIALDSLTAQPFTLELKAGRLTFETPDSLAARVSDATEIPIRFHRQAGGISLTTMARVPTPQGDLWMQLDSGSDAPLLVARTSAAPLGLDPDTARQALSLTVAPGVVAQADTRVRDMIIDGNIGLPVMKDWIMTFDLANQKLWVRPAD